MHTCIPVSYREEGDPMFVFREKYSLDGVDSLPDDLVIGGSSEIDMKARITRPVAALVKCLSDNGYTLTEELLRALCAVEEEKLQEITDMIEDVMMVKLSWAPLIKDWDFPTDEAFYDILYLIYHDYFSGSDGARTTFPCGHRIVDRLFHIDRYNGCPLCGKPFQTADFVLRGQGTSLKELRLFTEEDMRRELKTLLVSVIPLDATQQESLKTLIGEYGLPDGNNSAYEGDCHECHKVSC